MSLCCAEHTLHFFWREDGNLGEWFVELEDGIKFVEIARHKSAPLCPFRKADDLLPCIVLAGRSP